MTNPPKDPRTRDEVALDRINEAIDCFTNGFPGAGLNELRLLKEMFEGTGHYAGFVWPVKADEPSKADETAQDRHWRPEGGTR